MKLFYTLILVLSTFCASAQYSNYYNVNKNIGVSGNLNINTIDYGQLALANAQREKNNLENQKYLDQRDKEISLAIATNPLLAYDYGTTSGETRLKNLKDFSRLSYQYVLPHKSLFVFAGTGRLENISQDGITTDINFYSPSVPHKTQQEIENEAKQLTIKVGQINDFGNTKAFVHKLDIGRANVWGSTGYVSTIIWEDDYQITITDNYRSLSQDGVYNFIKVRYYGNKKEITFEQLEGRRYYLRRLIEKIISTGYNYEYSFK